MPKTLGMLRKIEGKKSRSAASPSLLEGLPMLEQIQDKHKEV
jgi:hypothetical protein